MPDHLRDRVAAVIDDLFGVPAEALHDEVTLQDGLQLDSLSVIELQVAVEDAFGTRFDDEVAGSVHTFGDLVAAVREAQDGRAGTDDGAEEEPRSA